MCLAIPGKIISIDTTGFMPMAQVDFGGIAREVCLAYVSDAQVGEYVIVHTGFAISKLDEEEAQETLRLLGELDLLQELGE
jgi:hydrogenase expression/formation protein HypC